MDPNVSYTSIGYLGLRMWSRQLFTYPAVDGQSTTPVPDIASEMPTVPNGGDQRRRQDVHDHASAGRPSGTRRRHVGITLKGVPSPNADFSTKYLEVPGVAKSGVWDLAVAGWGPDWYGDAALSYFGPLFSGPPSYPPVGSNFGFYNDPTTNSLIQQASSTVSQADNQVMKDAAFVPITSSLNANYHATQVHNAVYVLAFQNFDPTNVWLSKDVQAG